MFKTIYRGSIILFVFLNLLMPNVFFGKGTTMKQVTNIILFIGDGMGLAQLKAASIHFNGINEKFEIEKLPIVGFVTTHSADKLITDSAAGATAMATGYKTNNKMIGMTPDSVIVENIFEAAQKMNVATGIVATSHITDATPSCFVSHVEKRSMQDIIAEQMVKSKLKVILGGGKSMFLPESVSGSERQDNKNLILKAIDNGFSFVDSKEKLISNNSDRILGLFSDNGFQFNEKEPTLAMMTKKAIDILKKNENGFILMVEGSQIDWRGHDNNFYEMIEQVKLFDDAVKVGKAFAEMNSETLIIVTSDHETGGLTLSDETDSNGQKPGYNWASGSHTAIPVPIFSYGPNSELFTGIVDNTDIAKKISKILNLNMKFNYFQPVLEKYEDVNKM